MDSDRKLKLIKIIIADILDNYFGKFDFHKTYYGRKILEIKEILDK